MTSGYSRQIRERISNAAEGTVFVSSDFADIADKAYDLIRRFSEDIDLVLDGRIFPSNMNPGRKRAKMNVQ